MTLLCYLVNSGAGFIGSSFVFRSHSAREMDEDWRGQKAHLANIADANELIDVAARDAQALRRAAGGMNGIRHFAALCDGEAQ